MNETQLKDILTQADEALGTESAIDSAALAQTARQRAAIRKRRRTELLAGGLFALLVGAFLLGYPQYNKYQEKKQIALQMEMQKELAALKAETEQTLALIQSVNQRAQKRKQLAALQQRLASLTAQADSTDRQDEELAGKLYYKAQALSDKSDSCNAVKTLYQQIIQTFPNSSYTSTVKEKLAQLDCLNGMKL